MDFVPILAASAADTAEACGPEGEQSWVCERVFELTGSETAADVADALSVPIRIVFVLLAAWIVTRLLNRAVQRTVQRVRDQGTVSILGATAPIPLSENAQLRRTQRAATISSVLRNVVSTVVWTVAALIVLGELGVDIGPILAAAGVAGIAIGFGTQTMVRDYLAGMFIVLEDQYGVGDEIEVDGIVGEVEWVTLRMTRIRDGRGVAWYVGNGEVRKVGNRSQREPSAGEPGARRSDDDGPDGPAPTPPDATDPDEGDR
ncbi:MAG: mechanosensitive ion channel family protein [Actinobacteria bacterium]|nr:mechanosensitive ion channel family protein [Actinomycetota bacterium]